MARNICSVHGCSEFVVGRGWCRKHYMRWKRHGNPLHVTPRSEWTRPTPEERFWPKVEKTATCWLWVASTTVDGYGIFRDGNMRYAHRVAYELLVGPIPEGLELDHLCNVRRCVNPAHLAPVTHAENLRNGTWKAHNTDKAYCKRGHPFDAENTYLHPTGKRQCKTCRRDYSREWQRRRRAMK